MRLMNVMMMTKSILAIRQIMQNEKFWQGNCLQEMVRGRCNEESGEIWRKLLSPKMQGKNWGAAWRAFESYGDVSTFYILDGSTKKINIPEGVIYTPRGQNWGYNRNPWRNGRHPWRKKRLSRGDDDTPWGILDTSQGIIHPKNTP